MHDGVEAAGPEWLPAAGGHGITGSTGEPVSGSARLGTQQTVEGEVSADDLAARLRSEVETGPTRPRTDVGEAVPGFEVEVVGEVVGLVPGGVASRAIIAAERLALDHRASAVCSKAR